MSNSNARERLLELLTDRALVGLRPAEELELISLIALFPDAQALANELDTAASATAIASVAGRPEAMPAHLFARIEADAIAQAPRGASTQPARLIEDVRRDPTRTIAMPDRPIAEVVAMPAPTSSPRPPVPIGRGRAFNAFNALGWVAAAACLMLAIGAWYFRPRTKIVTVVTPPSATSAPTPVPPPSPRVERDKLLARAGTATLPWASTKDPVGKSTSGDVVWNAAEQRGFMRFRGLAKNDPRNIQYQLWIFDKTRDDKYPVDGGVFDVDDESGDVIVPIAAKLPVSEASLFAVTIEKPGGVVVSKRERIVVMAKPTG